mmetsp:Transcript_56850/g.165039  ORF Transcript_56850/g.165039 Transcript_56850/m.165039 type:complete len:650 (-) Transcript_56850:128-2077(-)
MVLQSVREDHGRVLLDMLEALRQGAKGSTATTVRILAANDHDGVCAAKILVSILHQKGVKYTVVPVSGQIEITQNIEQLVEDAEVRSLVLLNCGASMPLQKTLDASKAPSDLRCFVVDAHRPFFLENLSRSAPRVLVYDDDPRIGELPFDECDDEDGDDDGPGPEDGEERALDDAEQADRKRKRLADRQLKRERKRQRVNEYYLSTYYAMPVAVSLFKLARQAVLASQDMLWAAAVSLVAYHEQGLLGKIEYERLAWEELKEGIDRANEDLSLTAPTPSAGGELGDTALDPASQVSDDESSLAPSRRRPPAMASESRQLRWDADLRLFMYKHWTLEESMNHSGYFYAVLELHRDKGVRALKNLFATVGIAPGDARQLYSCMPLPIRKSMRNRFSDVGKNYGLSKDKMYLQQFVLDRGPLGDTKHALWLKEISSSDAAMMLLSLLSFVPSDFRGFRVEHLPQREDGRRDTTAIVNLEQQARKDNFWRAFDMVLCKDPSSLREGIEQAIEVAKAVQVMGRFVKDTNLMRKSSRFYWCKVEQPPFIFRHPISVRRLAVWLLQVLYIHRPKAEAAERPLLLVVRDEVREVYLCVGATPNHLSDDLDEFGYLFRSVLRVDRSLKYRYDSFDKSFIEIALDDFDRFWEILQDCAE